VVTWYCSTVLVVRVRQDCEVDVKRTAMLHATMTNAQCMSRACIVVLLTWVACICMRSNCGLFLRRMHITVNRVALWCVCASRAIESVGSCVFVRRVGVLVPSLQHWRWPHSTVCFELSECHDNLNRI
jgi:hypothetical protein